MSETTATETAVLVGIVTRNRAEILPKAIASALAQRGVAVHVCVIDDGSSDATPEIQKRFLTMEWIRWPEARGYVAARNQLMASANEKYFVSLDDDAWFLQNDEIGIALDVLKQNPALGAIAFDILSPDRPDSRPRSEMLRVPTFIGCGHMLRLSAVRQVGFYDAMPGAYGGEEKDLSLRLLDAGYEVALLPGVHVWHDKTPLARHLPAQYQSGVCNDLMMTYRRTPLLFLPLAAPAKFFQHLRGAAARGMLPACWRGFGSFFRALPSAWRTRRPVRFATLRRFMQIGRS